MLIDTHCHLYKEYFDNLQEIINISKCKNVLYFINNGCDNKSNVEVLETTIKYKNVYGALGLHPEMVENYNLSDIKFIENNISNDKIVAIGEIGLDYHYTKDNKEKQKNLFEMQLKLAEKYNVPVIVHSRDATEDTINILKKYNVKGIIHSFSGSEETAKQYIKMGFLLGINGVVTFKNCNLKEVLKNVSIENIVLETDSPYLSPEPFRGKQNNPSNVYFVAKFLSLIYNISLIEVANKTSNNVLNLFNKIIM